MTDVTSDEDKGTRRAQLDNVSVFHICVSLEFVQMPEKQTWRPLRCLCVKVICLD